MTRMRWLTLGLLSLAILSAGACSLNPQPLPPASESADGGGGYDATNGGRTDSGTPTDGAIPSVDSGADVPPAPPGPDGAVDGESPDGETDAGDGGGLDAGEDAPEASTD